MPFNHVGCPELPKLERKVVDGKRVYVTPDGSRYPSVTTILSSYNKKGIMEWRKRVGEEEANKISLQASTRGTAVHKLCEDYLNNKEDYAKGAMPANVASFLSIRKILDERVSDVVTQESFLFSHFLKTAGQVDCIAKFDEKLSVIDFKTSRKIKKREYVKSYFMQESAYAVMWEEMTKQPIENLVTIIAVDHEEPQIFIEKRDDHIFDFIELRKTFTF